MMRFRRVEKDMGGMANVGLDQQHIQGKEDDVSTAESKTYIGSDTKTKVDMNKIKNTKIGDDIHYYVNGVEGRGIVVKMGSQYLDLFQQDGNVKTVNINDTFFVKDILVNKQWDNMDETERYEALQKIHAPTPRFIVKSWSALPDDIKNLLRKDGGLSGGSGSTYEEGETKDSETQDHARTGFAQNTQYDSSVKEKTSKEASLFKGDTGTVYKSWLESFVTKPAPTGTGADEPGNKPSQRKQDIEVEERSDENSEDWKKRVQSREGQADETNYGWEEGKYEGEDEHTSEGKKTGKKDIIESHPNKKGTKQSTKAELESLFKGEYRDYVTKLDEEDNYLGREGEDERGEEGDEFFENKPKISKPKPKKATDVDKGKRDVAAGYRVHTDTGEASHCGGNKKCERAHGVRCTRDGCEKIISERMGDIREHWAEHEAENKFLDSEQDKLRDRMSKEGKLKSDVEQGKYSNPGSTPEVGVSTDTKVDVPASTGYEERPHISVEEAGKLPRATFNPHGNDELHVRGSQDSKDQPKFSQPVDQNQPVRKVGAPDQHPNYGVRYGMKGGVKKVWCPEHQVWEETTKDWHD